MSEELNHIDQIFSKALDNARIEPPAGVWESVSSGMSSATAVKTSFVWFKSIWLWTGLSVLSLATGAYLYLSPKPTATLASEVKGGKQGIKQSENQQPEFYNQSPENRQVVPEKNSNTGNLNIAGKMSSLPVESEAADYIEPKIQHAGFSDEKLEVLSATKQIETKSGVSGQDSRQQAALQCVHSLHITVEALGQSKWKFTSNGRSESCYWNINSSETIRGGAQFEYSFEGKGGIHFVSLKAKNLQGCDDTARTVVVVQSESPETMLFIPDYLTPNADGINDDLKVGIGPVGGYNLLVFDKFNRQVFMSSSPETSWNGKAGFIDCEPGVYTVVLSYKTVGSANWKTVRKSVLLKRGEE